MEIITLRYPIGKFHRPKTFSSELGNGFIADIEAFPELVKKEIKALSSEQHDWIYRPDGWSIRQVVHHCADSHMNAFTRFKLALTENNPTIKAYEEAEWAKQDDYQIPIDHSIKILEGIHFRWAVLLKSMAEVDFKKTFYHPESKLNWSLYYTAALYSWHCKHHLAHIQQAKQYEGKF